MTQPLALVVYEKLLPGTQVVNRLQDLGYKVQTLSSPSDLVETAARTRPLLVLAGLESANTSLCAAISGLKRDPGTAHLPVLVFGTSSAPDFEARMFEAGATLVVSDAAILNHMPECLERALQVD